MVYSVTARPHARDAQLEDWPASMPRNVECEDRTKSRAKTVVKKIPSTISADRRLLLRFFQPSQTLFVCLPLSPLPLLLACIKYSALDQSANNNIRINNRHRVLSLSLPAGPSLVGNRLFFLLRGSPAYAFEPHNFSSSVVLPFPHSRVEPVVLFGQHVATTVPSMYV